MSRRRKRSVAWMRVPVNDPGQPGQVLWLDRLRMIPPVAMARIERVHRDRKRVARRAARR